MPISTLLALLALLLLIAALPTWPYSRDWGYRTSGWLGVLLVLLLIMAASGAF